MHDAVLELLLLLQRVRVVEPQDQRPPVLHVREVVVQQRRFRMADVQVPGGLGGEARHDARALHVLQADVVVAAFVFGGGALGAVLAVGFGGLGALGVRGGDDVVDPWVGGFDEVEPAGEVHAEPLLDGPLRDAVGTERAPDEKVGGGESWVG